MKEPANINTTTVQPTPTATVYGSRLMPIVLQPNRSVPCTGVSAGRVA